LDVYGGQLFRVQAGSSKLQSPQIADDLPPFLGGHCDGSHACLRNTISHVFVDSEATITMAEAQTIQLRGLPPRSIITMAGRAAFAEDPCADLMIVTCDVWIRDCAFQAANSPNKVLQAETTANVRHEPKLTP
jgi:hypothetical protein